MGTSSTKESGFERYMQQANRAELLDRDTEHEVAILVRRGDAKARTRLLEANMRYVVAIALRYRRYGVALAELVSEGNVGLCIAASKFDPERGTRFVTYAGHWIRAQMIEHVLRNRTMVGGGAGALRSKVFFRLNRERARLDASVSDPVERLTMLASAFGTTEANAGDMLARLDSRDVSLDAPIGTDGGTTRVELMAGDELDPLEALERARVARELSMSVGRALARLDARERRIVVARGLGEEAVTLAEIAREFGVSRERARQLEARAHGKLRLELSRFAAAAA